MYAYDFPSSPSKEHDSLCVLDIARQIPGTKGNSKCASPQGVDTLAR